MRTTLDIPEDLFAKVLAATNYKTKTDVVIYALEELLKARQREVLRGLAGKIDIDIDLGKTRKRTKSVT